MLILLFACTGKPAPDTAVDTEGFALAADEHVALPFVSVGDAAPEAELVVTGVGGASEGGVTLTVEGDFEVMGDEAPFGADEVRRYTVRYTGDTSDPVIASGAVTVTVDGLAATTSLVAVVGDAELPDARWGDAGWGDQATFDLPSAPFPYGDAPYEDASVLVFVPYDLTDRDGVGVVTHLHGWRTVLDEFAPGQRLAEQLALSGRDAVLIVPQGPVHAEDGDFGRLMEPGGHAALVRDVLSVLYRDGYLTRPELGELALTAHSGGYLAAAAILENGDLPVTAVHLFDALYGERATFRDFVEAGGVLRSAYTATGGTETENVALLEELTGLGHPVGTRFTDDALLLAPVTIGPVEGTHEGCVRDERAYARWLAVSGLAHRPAWPPEIVSTVSDGYETTVSWRSDFGTSDLHYRVEGSDDGNTWALLTDTSDTSAVVPHTPWIRVAITDIRYGDSAPSDAYGATGTDWLVVDAFDRALDGSYDFATHTFAAALADNLGVPFSIASNEAVATGEVSLGAFPRVLWMLGDEGLYDRTFSPAEMDAVAAFIAAGGTFVVSGAEVGYATDATWLSEVLHATFVSDDAGTTVVGDWTVGAHYDEDSPDVLSGDEVLWTWSTGEPAAVSWDDRVVVIGFGLENLSELDQVAALDDLRATLD